MTSKKITICGKEVELFYCAATENGYERISDGKTIGVFIPTFKMDEEGNHVIDQLPAATNEDYIMLAMAGIVAADTYYKREAVINSDDILYNATPTERRLLIDTIVELRNEWYEVPKIINEIMRKENAKVNPDEQPKN
jgi:hypothetical protein